MIIALSISRIADSIYARSALDATTKGTDIPAAITRDRAEALHRVISDVAAETIATLGPSVLSTDLSDSDIITIDYAISHADAAVACLRTNIETAIVCATLARITAASDLPLAQWYASLARIADTSLPGRIARC